VSYVEIREVGFAGINMKTDDDGTAVMRNVKLHDLYIHDTGSEGFYIGSTQAPPQHPVEHLEISNCRVLRTGTEALQLGQLGTGTHIHHNVFALAAIDWKSAFQRYQDSNTQIGVRYGRGSIHHNIFIGAANSLLSYFSQVRTGDRDNHFELPVNLTNRFAGENGSAGNLTATGNVRGPVAPVVFNNFGFPASFDYLSVELWTDVCSRCPDPSTPVYYQPGDHVMHLGILYRNVSSAPVTGTVPGTNPQVWQSLGFPPDDVRLAPSSPYPGFGLLDRVQ
jgi:hypothetical protein